MSVEDTKNQEGAGVPTPSNDGNTGTDNEGDNKTLTQEEVNALIGKTKSEAKAKATAELEAKFEERLAEEKRLQALSEKELKKELESKRESEIAEREKNAILRENELDARDAFEELGYNKPSRLAKIAVSGDTETQAANIKAIDEVVKETAEAMVEKQLSGKTDTDFGASKSSTPSGATSVVTEM